MKVFKAFNIAGLLDYTLSLEQKAAGFRKFQTHTQIINERELELRHILETYYKRRSAYRYNII